MELTPGDVPVPKPHAIELDDYEAGSLDELAAYRELSVLDLLKASVMACGRAMSAARGGTGQPRTQPGPETK